MILKWTLAKSMINKKSRHFLKCKNYFPINLKSTLKRLKQSLDTLYMIEDKKKRKKDRCDKNYIRNVLKILKNINFMVI
jgi:hypothetical protein